jgi:transposase
MDIINMPEMYCKMKESGYRVLKCPRYGFEVDKDAVAVMNIEMKALFMMEGKSLATPTAPQMTDVAPNR